VESIPAKMNRLVVFDPKIPHGVRRIEGNLNPVQGRLVIHGWFVQPRPFIEGPLSSQRLQKHIEALSETVQEFMAQEIPLTGLLSLTFEVSLSGTASNVRVLSDTTRVPFEFEAFRKKLISQLKKEIGAFRFNPQKAKSRVTLPLVFERSSSRRK
jgi:hypothetical protein